MCRVVFILSIGHWILSLSLFLSLSLSLPQTATKTQVRLQGIPQRNKTTNKKSELYGRLPQKAQTCTKTLPFFQSSTDNSFLPSKLAWRVQVMPAKREVGVVVRKTFPLEDMAGGFSPPKHGVVTSKVV